MSRTHEIHLPHFGGFDVHFAPASMMKGLKGWCDSEANIIHVWDELEGEELLDVVLHETLHAALPLATEEWVNELAAAQARLLCELGFGARLGKLADEVAERIRSGMRPGGIFQ